MPSGSKGVARHRTQRASVGVGIQGHGHPRAWTSKGVAGLRTRRASKGVGIHGRGHQRASSASKGVVGIQGSSKSHRGRIQRVTEEFLQDKQNLYTCLVPCWTLVPMAPGEADSFRHRKDCFNNTMKYTIILNKYWIFDILKYINSYALYYFTKIHFVRYRIHWNQAYDEHMRGIINIPLYYTFA